MAARTHNITKMRRAGRGRKALGGGGGKSKGMRGPVQRYRDLDVLGSQFADGLSDARVGISDRIVSHGLLLQIKTARSNCPGKLPRTMASGLVEIERAAGGDDVEAGRGVQNVAA